MSVWGFVVTALIILVAGCGPNDHSFEPPPRPAATQAGVIAPPLELDVKHVSGNHYATCVIDAHDQLRCWGPVPRAWTGHEEVAEFATPTQLDDERYLDVSVGAYHACAIREDGTVWCRGRNCAGQLGDTTIGDSTALVRVPALEEQQQIAVGGGKSCAIDVHGALTCWGGADYGQAQCTLVTKQRPTRIPGAWQQVSANFYAVYAIDDQGKLHRILDGEVTSTLTFRNAPEPVGESTWVSIATGVAFACGVRDDGTLACIRDGEAHETLIGDEADWQGVVAADYDLCAIKTDGTLWCGRDLYEYAGVELEQVGADDQWSDVSVGVAHVCGIRGGQVSCWGSNDLGQLGTGCSD